MAVAVGLKELQARPANLCWQPLLLCLQTGFEKKACSPHMFLIFSLKKTMVTGSLLVTLELTTET